MIAEQPGFEFDAQAVLREIRARNSAKAAKAATLLQNEPDCSRIAVVAAPSPADGGADCSRIAVVAAPSPADGGALTCPPIYQDTWSRLLRQRPMASSDSDWQQAIIDGRRFLEQWGEYASAWGWTPGELFDVPRLGRPGGIIWQCAGAHIESFGPEYLRYSDGREYDRGPQPFNLPHRSGIGRQERYNLILAG